MDKPPPPPPPTTRTDIQGLNSHKCTLAHKKSVGLIAHTFLLILHVRTLAKSPQQGIPFPACAHRAGAAKMPSTNLVKRVLGGCIWVDGGIQSAGVLVHKARPPSPAALLSYGGTRVEEEEAQPAASTQAKGRKSCWGRHARPMPRPKPPAVHPQGLPAGHAAHILRHRARRAAAAI